MIYEFVFDFLQGQYVIILLSLGEYYSSYSISTQMYESNLIDLCHNLMTLKKEDLLKFLP